MKISKDSWHYKVYAANKNRYEIEHQSHNLCKYIRHVIFGLFLMAGFCGGVLFLIAGFLTSIFYWCFLGTNPPDWCGPGFVLTSVFILLAVGFYATYLFKDKVAPKINRWMNDLAEKQEATRRRKIENVQPKKGPGFIALAYKNVKDKMCHMIEFE